jgi:tetratricopeptide (TPR) repeat protein
MQLRAYAWKDLGKAYLSLSRFAEAITALKRAESYLVGAGTLAHDLAIVRFNLAVVYQETERYTDSLELLADCKTVFREHGDTRLLLFCGIAEGVLLQRLRRYREAREIYLLLLASAKPIEPESLAALHKAIGLCSIELADYPEAESNLHTSIQLYRELGQPIEELKAQAGLGRLYVRRGTAREAVLHLRPIRRAFLSNAMPEEAGICALEIIEGLITLGKAAEAESLARLVVREFTSAGLNTRAVTALGYLTEALATRRATVDLVGNVREYILSLRTEPEREFTHHA